MIERITGTVAAKAEENVVIDVGGVGFLMEVSAMTLRDVPGLGAETVLFTHLHVREDALQLFGFSTEEERELFRLFLGVSKIGPRLALAALSCRPAPGLKQALAAGDVALFSSVPGIGKKTAERLILELRDKVGEAGAWAVAVESSGAPAEDGSLAVARAALVELGFAVQEADKLLSRLEPDQPAEDLIRQALARRA
ncbi:MAG: Holliday junction branch migration protein RuvA [bacterium]